LRKVKVGLELEMFWSRCDVTTDYVPGAGLKVEEGEGWAGVGNVLEQV
jgi:hypothetical protein